MGRSVDYSRFSRNHHPVEFTHYASVHSSFTVIYIAFKSYIHWHLCTLWIVKGLKGIVVNRTMSSLHLGSLEITLTVPLSLEMKSKACICWLKQILNDDDELFYRSWINLSWRHFCRESVPGPRGIQQTKKVEPLPVPYKTHLLVTADLSATERKLSKQSLIGRIRTNPDLGFSWARVLQKTEVYSGLKF